MGEGVGVSDHGCADVEGSDCQKINLLLNLIGNSLREEVIECFSGTVVSDLLGLDHGSSRTDVDDG